MTESNFTDIEDLLSNLDVLVSQGWHPVLNFLGNGIWHVGLHHETAPMPVVVFTRSGVVPPEGHRYRIHGRGPTLRSALLDALRQVDLLVTSK